MNSGSLFFLCKESNLDNLKINQREIKKTLKLPFKVEKMPFKKPMRGLWTKEEDEKIIKWVKRHGPFKWSSCSRTIKGRNGKQCRDRWTNILNPKVDKTRWTAEEEYFLYFLFPYIGRKWTVISKFFPGRTENLVKNRFYSSLRKIYLQVIKNEEPEFTLSKYLIPGISDLIKLFPIAKEIAENRVKKELNLGDEEFQSLQEKMIKKLSSSKFFKQLKKEKIFKIKKRIPQVFDAEENINPTATQKVNEISCYQNFIKPIAINEQLDYVATIPTFENYVNEIAINKFNYQISEIPLTEQTDNKYSDYNYYNGLCPEVSNCFGLPSIFEPQTLLYILCQINNLNEIVKHIENWKIACGAK